MKRVLVVGLLASVALMCTSLYSQFTDGGEVFHVVLGAFLTGTLAAFLRVELKSTRRRTPAPRSVSEGCGSNHREAGDDV